MLCKYLFNQKENESVKLDLTAKSDMIQFRLEGLVGEYKPCTNDVIDKIVLEFLY